MKTTFKVALALPLLIGAFILVSASPTKAQGPQGRELGLGITLGNPLGATLKYWTSPNTALVADIGADYFGSPRLDLDYHWHFDAFNSSVVKLYAGPGLALGFGNGSYYLWYGRGHDYYFIRDNGGMAVGARILLGMNVIPRNSPIELYMEFGPLIGLSPNFGSSFDLAIGMRFYP